MAKGESVMTSQLLIHGQPMVLTKELAVKIGVTNAIFLQQIHYMISRYGKEVDGEKRLRWSIDKWQSRVFPFWSERTLHRIISDAETKGWLNVLRQPGATALFSIDYDILEAEFKGDRSAKVAHHGGAKVAHPQGCQNGTPQGCQNGTPVPHIERDTAQREKNQETSGSAVAEAAQRSSRCSARSSAGELQRKANRKTEQSAVEKFARRATVENALLFWRQLLSTYGYKRAALAFTKAERGMVRNLLRMMGNGDGNGKRISAFLEFAVSNWKMLRKKIVWDNNPNRSKLSEIPTFQEVFFNKEDIMHYQANPEGVKTSEQKEKVYTDLSQVPKSHPKFKQIAFMIRQYGKATLQ